MRVSQGPTTHELTVSEAVKIFQPIRNDKRRGRERPEGVVSKLNFQVEIIYRAVVV